MHRGDESSCDTLIRPNSIGRGKNSNVAAAARASILALSALTLLVYLIRPAQVDGQVRLPQEPLSGNLASKGVAVEVVEKGADAETAGLQSGDVLLAWSRGGQLQEIASPFDWPAVTPAPGTSVPLILRGLRGSNERTWTLSSILGITLGPVILPSFALSYHECRELSRAGKSMDSARCWRAAVTRVQTADPPWLVLWILDQVGQLSAKGQQWNEMNRAYGEALDRAKNSDARIATLLMHTWLSLTRAQYNAELASQQRSSPGSLNVAKALVDLAHLATVNGDVAEAEHDLRDVVTIRERLSPNSLSLAESLAALADVLRLRGELAQADEYFQRALTIQKVIAPNSEVVAITLSQLGLVAFLRGDIAGAERNYGRGLEIAQGIDPEGVTTAAILAGLASVAFTQRDLTQAEQLATHALAIREKKLAPKSLPVAESLDEVGGVLLARGEIAKAEEYLGRAQAINQTLGPTSPELAVSLTGLGDAAAYRGDYAKAESYYGQALEIRQKAMPNSLAVASSLFQLGDVAQHRGDWPRAAQRYQEALVIQNNLSPKGPFTATTLFRLGAVYSSLGDPAKGEGYLRRAQAIQNDLTPGDLSSVMRSQAQAVLEIGRSGLDQASRYFEPALRAYENLAPGNESAQQLQLYLSGVMALNRGELATAEEDLLKASAIAEKLSPGGLDAAADYSFLGLVERIKGDRAKAEQYLQRALLIQEKLAPVSISLMITLGNLGLVALENGNAAKAELYFSATLAISDKLVPGTSYHANVLRCMGWISRQKGQLDVAEHYFSRSVAVLEGLTGRLGGSEEARANFRAERQEYYQDYLETLLALKRPEDAFHVLERGRARSLLAMLAERDLVFGADLPAEIDRARKLNAASYDQAYAQLAKLNPEKNAAENDRLLTKLRDLNTEREQIAEEVRRRSPWLAALQYPQPLDLMATRQMLDAGTALLSYSVSKQKVVLFVVRPMQEAPGLSVFTIATDEQKLGTQVAEFRKLILERRTLSDTAFVSLARQLYDLLIKPVEAAVTTSQRLLVVPDGALNALPFAALLRSRNEYLVEWKPLHTVVSASVYAELKKERRHAAKQVELVAFGDPRYPAKNGSPGQRAGDVDLQSAVERGLTLSPLLFSRAEVDAITALFPGHSRKYEGLEATEERAKSVGTNVRYIHFAVHGILDDRLPLNSALALTVPEKVADGRDNGLLQAWEIFEQVRVDADLVTLSACNTGLGQELNGEGLIGLTRAFQYAGAHSILASLWSVDDLRTMQLMKEVYSGLRTGKSKDQALRDAQLSLLRSQPSSSPYYWAAFSLIGDWR